MDSCHNTHALRQFEADAAEAERRAIEAEEGAVWQFTQDCQDQDKLAAIIAEYEVDLSPIIQLLFRPIEHNDMAMGRIADLRNRTLSCFHQHICSETIKELDKC